MTARCLLVQIAVSVALLIHPASYAQATFVLTGGQARQVQQTPGYTVTGRVVCADTQHAARFAEVTLVPATGSDYDRGRTAVGRTDLDGRFSIANVQPGEYFATAEMSGYVNDAPSVRSALSSGADAASISGVPRLQVTNGGGTVQLNLQRGAVIAGTATWDDGTPAAGLMVGVQSPPSTGSSQLTAPNGGGFARTILGGGFGRVNATDDRGRFRLSGLAAGNYIVQISVQSPLPDQPGEGRFPRTVNLTIFSPNKLRRSEAAVISLAPGEERNDVNIVLNLNGLHNVAGEVSSSSVAVHSGNVLLTDQTDSSLSRRGVINSDGSFTVPYVPAGTYTLRVNASSQMAAPGRGNPPDPNATRFQPLQESVTVTDGDLTGLSLTMTPANASQ